MKQRKHGGGSEEGKRPSHLTTPGGLAGLSPPQRASEEGEKLLRVKGGC
tara:strand:- start:438 stop:584 length:147 start_codon:yes stop_codon:yes gene_type:complete